ncbi:MAG: PD-(D/E)XK nuclease domain-containing protein, partial [Deltaproteobacteria bacterium]|nr:PD-(D/E)XK nuclease domain-containing protein [Deltaproteobacteria bacterium]
VLFHSGYLTIDRLILENIGTEREPDMEEMFTFKIPNREVSRHYKSFCFQQIFDRTHENFVAFSENLRYSLLKKDTGKMAEILGGLLFGIVHKHHEPDESFYHSLFQTAFIAAGLEAKSEQGGSRGNSDIAIFLDGRVRVVTELKYVRTDETSAKSDTDRAREELAAALDKAEKAIREKKYAEPFKLVASEIICLALAVRGRDEVAVRFMPPDEPDGQSA